MSAPHEACIAILVGEFLMGVQPWFRSKSFLMLGFVVIGFVLGLAISLVLGPFKRREDESTGNSGPKGSG